MRHLMHKIMEEQGHLEVVIGEGVGKTILNKKDMIMNIEHDNM